MPRILLLAFAFFCLSVTGSAQNQPPAQMDSAQISAVLRRASQLIKDSYVYPDKATAITQYLLEQSRAGKYKEKTNPHEFAGAVNKDIRTVCQDKHLRLEYNPKLEKDIVAFTSSKKGATGVVNADIQKEEKQNFYFRKVEILPSNIGYLEFTNFVAPSPSARKTIQAAMQFVAHTDALVIDLRNNFGGNVQMANEILSYFFKVKTLTGRNFNRLENKWTDDFVENKKAVTSGLVLEMPLYILTSNRTFSAAEGLAYTLQQLHNAILVGDTTRGGAHLTRNFSVGNGFVAFVPYLRTENAKTKTDWEGTGVVPNLPVEESKALMTAQIAALQQKQASAQDPVEKRKAAWLLGYYQAKSSPAPINAPDYKNAIGRFAEFEIALQDNQLVFRDTNQRSKEFLPMVAISPVLFQIGGDYQVELVKDATGQFNSIKMFWEDGWTEEIKRN